MNEDSDKKEKFNLKLRVFLIVINVIITIVCCFLIYDIVNNKNEVVVNDKTDSGSTDKNSDKDSGKKSKNDNDKDKEKDKNQDNDKEDSVESNIEEVKDPYDYALLSYVPGDGSFREYYRIVEFNKNSNDRVLASYNSTRDNELDVYILSIADDRIYYILSFEEDGYYYSNIMYIDLNNKNGQPVELINWKQKEYSKLIMSGKAVGSFVYFTTRSSDKYKYDVNAKKLIDISEDDYLKSIVNYNDSLKERKIYFKNKELIIDNYGNIKYDGEVIYKVDVLYTYLYSFDGELLFMSSTKDSGRIYYKYNFDTKNMETFNLSDKEAYTINIISE